VDGLSADDDARDDVLADGQDQLVRVLEHRQVATLAGLDRTAIALQPQCVCRVHVAPTITSAAVMRNHGAATPSVVVSDVAWIEEQ
jgi:hypothetical protein